MKPTHRTLTDLLADMDRTFKMLCYDDHDRQRGIEDDDRSEQLHSDLYAVEQGINDLLSTPPTSYTLEPEDYSPSDALSAPAISYPFQHEETRQIVRQEVSA